MKQIICLYGAPGSGKSTCAASLFAHYKQRGGKTELVREYIKHWVWENRAVKPYDEAYIAVKQARQEAVLLGKVDTIITDCPLYVSAFYERKYHPSLPGVSMAVINRHEHFCREAGYEVVNVFLQRVKPYVAQGRFQSEEEADNIAREMQVFLAGNGVNFKIMPGDPQLLIEALGL